MKATKSILQGLLVISVLFGGLLAEPLVDKIVGKVDGKKIEKKVYLVLDFVNKSL